MTRLPIIAGFGGRNTAGRSSGHHGYRRMVIEALSKEKALETRAAIAALTGKLKRKSEGWVDNEGNAVDLASYINAISGELDQNTLIRELEDNLFDPNQLNYHCRANLASTNGRGIEFELKKKQLPTPLPAGWSIKSDTTDDPNKVRVNIEQSFEVLLECFRKTDVNSAGQLPTGFKPELLYQARNHPRALQLTA